MSFAMHHRLFLFAKSMSNMKMNERLKYSCSVLAVIAVSACAQNYKPQDSSRESKGVAMSLQKNTRRTTEEVSSLVNTLHSPQNLNELLENIKFLVSNDLLLQEEAFTQANFERILGAKAVTVGREDDGHIWLRGGPFGFLLNQSGEPTDVAIGTQISASIINLDGGRRRGFVGLIVNQDNKPHFDSVEAIFGNEWKVEINPPPLHGPPTPRTDPHGYETVDFLFENSLIRRVVAISFFGNGSISRVGLSEETK